MTQSRRSGFTGLFVALVCIQILTVHAASSNRPSQNKPNMEGNIDKAKAAAVFAQAGKREGLEIWRIEVSFF